MQEYRQVMPSPVGAAQAGLVGGRVGGDLQDEDALQPDLAHRLRRRDRDAQDGPHHLGSKATSAAITLVYSPNQQRFKQPVSIPYNTSSISVRQHTAHILQTWHMVDSHQLQQVRLTLP